MQQMSETALKLASRLEREGTKTIEFFSRLPTEIWDKTVYTDGASWRVAEVLAHIVEAESALPRLFRHIAEGGEGVPQDFDLNGYNEESVKHYREQSPEELVTLFMERRGQTADFVGNLTDEELAKEGNHPFMGKAPLGEMIRLFYLHVQLHMRDIRGLLDERKV
jgi:hypothetical protein